MQKSNFAVGAQMHCCEEFAKIKPIRKYRFVIVIILCDWPDLIGRSTSIMWKYLGLRPQITKPLTLNQTAAAVQTR